MSIEKYCIPVDILPSLSEESCNKIIEYSNQNISRYNSWINKDGKTISQKGIYNIGLSSFRLSDYDEGYEFAKSILENDNINLNYENLALALQRSRVKLVPHTDPGRNVTLLFHIMGISQTDFYTTDNFTPGIDYTNTKLTLESSIIMNIKKWYLFNNAAIHGIRKIYDERLTLVINLGGKFLDFNMAKNNLKSILK